MPEPGARPRHLGDDRRAMRDVGIVAGILDDAGARAARRQFGERQRKARLLPARQADRHRIGELAGQQRGDTRPARRPRRKRRWSSLDAADWLPAVP